MRVIKDNFEFEHVCSSCTSILGLKRTDPTAFNCPCCGAIQFAVNIPNPLFLEDESIYIKKDKRSNYYFNVLEQYKDDLRSHESKKKTWVL